MIVVVIIIIIIFHMDIWYFINFIENIMSMNFIFIFSWTIWYFMDLCEKKCLRSYSYYDFYFIFLEIWISQISMRKIHPCKFFSFFFFFFFFGFLMDIWYLTQFRMKTCLKNHLLNLYFHFIYFCHVASFILVFDIPICLLFESLNHESAP
jgi:hypothetical protein